MRNFFYEWVVFFAALIASIFAFFDFDYSRLITISFSFIVCIVSLVRIFVSRGNGVIKIKEPKVIKAKKIKKESNMGVGVRDPVWLEETLKKDKPVDEI